MQEIEDAIRVAVEHALRNFQSSNPAETIYALAIIRSSVGDHLHCAIATEERLHECAMRYKNNLDLASKKQWLRWANPDDGWFQETFAHFRTACEKLSNAIESGKLSEFDDRISGLLCEVLKQISMNGTVGSNVVLGITHGEDPQEFVYWSSKINSPELHQRLEREFEISQEIESRLEI